MIDLSMLRGDNDVAAGVSFKVATYQAKLNTPQGEMDVQMPVMELTFMMANERVTRRICIPPDMVLALAANLLGWRLALEHQQGDQK